jgi:cell division protein FtsZ
MMISVSTADLDHLRQGLHPSRGEVDADANIIVGATLDEGLDGMIRVSVVATGVDIASADSIHLSMLSRALASPEIPVPVQRPSRMMWHPRINPSVAAKICISISHSSPN